MARKNESINACSTDILLGRGNSFKNHPGNIRFRAIINEQREAYFDTKTQKEKRKFTEGIVRLMQEVGRFLVRDCNTWKEASFEIARQKVAHAMQYRQRCLTANCFSSELSDSSTSSVVAIEKISDDVASSYSDSEDKWLRSEPIVDSSNLEDTATMNNEMHPAKLRDVSDVVKELHVKNPVNTCDQQFEPTFDSASSKDYCCLLEHDEIPLNEMVLMTSHVLQSCNALEENHEAMSLKPTDEQSGDDVPLPLQSVLRVTSDFSFGDFSLNDEFLSNIADGNHKDN